MKRCLFVNFNCAYNTHFETELELMHKSQMIGDEVYSLFCKGGLNKYCAVAYENEDKLICDYCQAKYYKGMDLINLPIENRFSLKRDFSGYPEYIFTKYESFSELAKIKYKNINIGDNIARTYKSIVSIQADHIVEMPDDFIFNSLVNSISVLDCFIDLHKSINFDCLFFFSGRFPEYYPLLKYCQDNDIVFYVHDRGANYNKYCLIENSYFNDYQKVLDAFVTKNLKKISGNNYQEIGKQWFEAKLKGSGAAWLSYTKDQEASKLPDDFDRNKHNIVIFNSSLHEISIDDSWAPLQCFKDEILLFRTLCEYYKDKPEYHFILRCHPNIAFNSGEQLERLEEFKTNSPSNLSIVLPREKVDSYELVKKADIVIASFSTTVGVEAVYLRKPSILLGPALFSHLNTVYKPENMDKLFELLDNKELPPKPYENALKYGYCMATYGEEFEYYQPTGIFEGTFMGVDLNKSHKFLPLLGKIKRFYYKQKASILKRLKPGSC